MSLRSLTSLRCRNFNEKMWQISAFLREWVCLSADRVSVSPITSCKGEGARNFKPKHPILTKNSVRWEQCNDTEGLCGWGMKQITRRGSSTDKWIKSGYVFTRVNMVCNSGIQYSRNAHNSSCNCWFTLRLQSECTVPSWKGKPQCATVSVKSCFRPSCSHFGDHCAR